MFAVIDELVGDRAESWDLAGRIPSELLRELGARGLLCSQVGAAYGGRDLSSHDNGRLTAHTGSRCSSLRSVMTSQGMAAWTIQRLATPDQSAALLPQLVSGQLAAVAFSETDAGSDLSGWPPASGSPVTRSSSRGAKPGSPVRTTRTCC